MPPSIATPVVEVLLDVIYCGCEWQVTCSIEHHASGLPGERTNKQNMPVFLALRGFRACHLTLDWHLCLSIFFFQTIY